jgi:penicillin-binding protein 1C
MAGLSGATSAAMVAHDILIDLHGADSDGLADSEFRPPAGLKPATLCAATGKPSDGHCDHMLTEFMPQSPIVPVPLQTAALTPAPAAPHPRIATPNNHSTFIRNPEMPAALAFLPLRLMPDAGLAQVVWYVDGKPFQVADAGDTARWPLAAGHHTIQARAPFGDAHSAEIEVTVR